jgi:2-keto-4-pentenoate hydratase/2-oxohepta-3-ene-1,7-dioic acid hydratase in catechol pathway
VKGAKVKLACVESDGLLRVVLVLENELVDMTAQLGVEAADLLKFLEMGPEALVLAERCANAARPRLAKDSVRFRAPITADKILGVGMNYHSFVAKARRLGVAVPTGRLWFYRARACITGPYDDVWLPRNATDLDYEGELAIVIGRRCRYVSAAEAPAVLAGFTIANDLTLRQRAVESIVLGKSFDTHTPTGPCIGTPEEFLDPHNLEVRTWVNGELRQESNTADMIADCYELIAEISSACTLNPGDIILTGTPDGSGIFRRPPQSLAVGDTVRIAIEGIGEIENRVVHEPAGVCF